MDLDLLKVSLKNRAPDGLAPCVSIPIGDFTIGRHADCSLRINSKLVSRRHCVIRCGEASVSIRDLGSRNGTVVDGTKIGPDEERMLGHHSIVRVGDTKLRLSIRIRESGAPWRAADNDTDTGDEHNFGSSSCLADSKQIFDELDQIDTEFRSGTKSWTTADLDLPTKSAAECRDGMASESDASPNAAEPSQTVSASEKKPASAEDVDSQQKERDIKQNHIKREPARLPDHLRPKSAVDSQEAANQTLSRFFSGN